jgi:hypothetical protein
MVCFVCCVCCRRSASHAANHIFGVWDEIYLLLLRRCEILRTVARLLRHTMPGEPHVVTNLDYLLNRMAQTSDLRTHAGIQNGLLLTLKTAVECCHKESASRLDPELREVVREVGAVDSALLALRDHHNHDARSYGTVYCSFPFRLLLPRELWRARDPFLMVLPWWSIDPAAYGSISATDLRKYMEDEEVPLILAPGQRGKPGEKQIVSVRGKEAQPQFKAAGGTR